MEKSLELRASCFWEKKSTGQTRRTQKYYPRPFPLHWAAMKGCRSRALPGSCSHLLLQLGFSLRQGWDPGMAPEEAEALRPVPGGGGSTEELQNLRPLLSTCLQRAWTRSSGLGSTSAPWGCPRSLCVPAAAPGMQPARS